MGTKCGDTRGGRSLFKISGGLELDVEMQLDAVGKRWGWWSIIGWIDCLTQFRSQL